MERGFFQSLFDISFTSFITTKIVKFLYILALVLIGLGALAFIASAFRANAALGLVVLLIVAPLGSLLYVIYTRVVLEVIIQIFRINEHLRDQINMQQTAFANAGWLPQAPPPQSVYTPAPDLYTPPPEPYTRPEVSTPPPVLHTPPPPPPPPPAATPQCSNCGAPATPGQRFCRNCGTPIA
jgi:hypothetical protein